MGVSESAPPWNSFTANHGLKDLREKLPADASHESYEEDGGLMRTWTGLLEAS